MQHPVFLVAWQSVLDTTLYDKVSQCLGAGQWFSAGALVSSINSVIPVQSKPLWDPFFFLAWNRQVSFVGTLFKFWLILQDSSLFRVWLTAR